MIETILLSLTGAAIGIGGGLSLIGYYHHNGFDLSKFSSGMEQIGFDAIVYPFLTPGFIVDIIILVIITGILSALIPARRALKLKPVEAIRTI